MRWSTNHTRCLRVKTCITENVQIEHVYKEKALYCIIMNKRKRDRVAA